MIRYECDKCGAALPADDAQRYIVKMEIFAATGHIELDAESSADTQSQLEEVIHALASADPDEVEDQTYRSFRFDVCDSCRRKILRAPLG